MSAGLLTCSCGVAEPPPPSVVLYGPASLGAGPQTNAVSRPPGHRIDHGQAWPWRCLWRRQASWREAVEWQSRPHLLSPWADRPGWAPDPEPTQGAGHPGTGLTTDKAGPDGVHGVASPPGVQLWSGTAAFSFCQPWRTRPARRRTGMLRSKQAARAPDRPRTRLALALSVASAGLLACSCGVAELPPPFALYGPARLGAGPQTNAVSRPPGHRIDHGQAWPWRCLWRRQASWRAAVEWQSRPLLLSPLADRLG